MSDRSAIIGIRVGVSAAIVRDGAVLLVAFEDESGFHYNLPGGGVNLGESLHDAVRREVREETCAEVEVGRLLLVWEHVPSHANRHNGNIHKLGLIFAAQLLPGSEPSLPDVPDPNQVDVHWVPLVELAAPSGPRRGPLLPQIGPRLVAALASADPADPFWAPAPSSVIP